MSSFSNVLTAFMASSLCAASTVENAAYCNFSTFIHGYDNYISSDSTSNLLNDKHFSAFTLKVHTVDTGTGSGLQKFKNSS